MNIYIIPAWYPKNESDVTASFIREQSRALHKRGHNIIVIYVEPFSLRNCLSFIRYKNHDWDDKGIIIKYRKVLTLVPSRFEQKYHKHLSNKYYKILKKSINYDANNNFKPDIIHSHVGPWCSYFAIPAAKKFGLPIITTEHYSGLTFGNMEDLKFQREKYVIDNSDLTIFVGSRFRDKVLSVTQSQGKTMVIPNQIDMNKFKVFNNKKRDNFSFLVACYLVKRKRVDLIIQALHEEFGRNENISLVIAGDGPERNNLEDLATSLGESERIIFNGKYGREEVPTLFSNCHAFVLTSEFEPFGIVYIEAMACGLPCIGTKGQGCDDIINESNGITVTFDNLEELKNAMRYIYENNSKYDPVVIKNDVANRFSEEAVCSLLESAYSEILEN